MGPASKRPRPGEKAPRWSNRRPYVSVTLLRSFHASCTNAVHVGTLSESAITRGNILVWLGRPRSADAREDPVLPACSGFPVVSFVNLKSPCVGNPWSVPWCMRSPPNLRLCLPCTQIRLAEIWSVGLLPVLGASLPTAPQGEAS